MNIPTSARIGVEYLRSQKMRLRDVLFDTERGDEASELHAKTDGNAIFVIAETNIGETFAGYQSMFDNVNTYKSDDHAWFAMCSKGTVYTPHPSHIDHVLTNKDYAPTWGGGHSLHLGRASCNFAGSYAKEHTCYVRTRGVASLPGAFSVTRLMIMKVYPGRIVHNFPRLRCLWNNDEVKSLEALANETSYEEIFPPPLSLTSTNVDELKTSLLQTCALRTAVIAQPDVLNALQEGIKLTTQEIQGIFVGRLHLTIAPLPPATTVINALHLLPHAACVEFNTCETKADVEVLSDLLRHAPATLTHIEVREISKLNEDMLSVLAQPLNVPHRIKLCFGSLPANAINPEVYHQMTISNPYVTILWKKALDEFPILPQFTTIVLNDPCLVPQLDNTSSIGFCVRNVKSSEPTTAMCIPCSRDKAKMYCKLFMDMEWKEGKEFVCSSDPENIPAAHPVKLLVAYLEYVANDERSRMDETRFYITAQEENFLSLMCPSLDDPVTVIRTVSQLMSAASYLNIPCLRRLLRSFVLRQSIEDEKLLDLIGS